VSDEDGRCRQTRDDLVEIGHVVRDEHFLKDVGVVLRPWPRRLNATAR
jgi:hypothetical protein